MLLFRCHRNEDAIALKATIIRPSVNAQEALTCGRRARKPLTRPSWAHPALRGEVRAAANEPEVLKRSAGIFAMPPRTAGALSDGHAFPTFANAGCAAVA